ALHGVALTLHKIWLAVIPGAKPSGAQMNCVCRIIGIVFTFNLVCFGWVIFRAESMQTVELLFHQIVFDFQADVIPQIVTGYVGVFALLAVGYLLHLMPARLDSFVQRTVTAAPMLLQVVMAAVLIWCVMQIKSSDIQPFIYFQF
ncbi:MAG: MBOAT family protein, partial [Alistipes sp.]|nr:MBOAT family protein [Alistipes sp.]